MILHVQVFCPHVTALQSSYSKIFPLSGDVTHLQFSIVSEKAFGILSCILGQCFYVKQCFPRRLKGTSPLTVMSSRSLSTLNSAEDGLRPAAPNVQPRCNSLYKNGTSISLVLMFVLSLISGKTICIPRNCFKINVSELLTVNV